MGNELAREVSASASAHQMKEKNDRDNVPNYSSESFLSFQAFGEKTNVPIQIRRAVVDVVDPLPFIPHFMASLELTVMNNLVKKDLAGKFRITLPVGATVKKFEILRREASVPPKWYPAVAVPKKKAKEVVYKEKEKGRDVAALADVASGSNMFEIEVAPLPFEVEVKCRMECMISGESGDIRELVNSYFPNDETEVILNAGEDTKMSKECRIAESGQVGGSAIGKAFGKTHFICHIPPVHNMGSGLAADNDEYCGINPIKSIAILWDASFSMSKHSSLNQKRLKLLRELANECNKHVESPVRFELYTFCVGAAVKKGVFGSVDELISTIEAIDYDGGTDVDTLSALLLQLSRHQHVDDSTEKGSCAIDCALIFTDGMDSLSKTPHFEGMHSVSFPVHVVADTDTVNLRCARALAAASAQCPGCIFSQKDESYLPGVLYKQAILKSIKTDQSEDAFLEEVDDGFRCVPDHRLQHLNEPIGSDGFTISGVLGEKDECTVSKVVATVAVGGELHEYCFLLGADSDTTKQDEHKGGAHERSAIHSYKAVHLGVANKTDDSSSEQSNPTRILGHLYAEAVYRAAEAFGFKSGTDMRGVREELSVEYGFCSPESSLLMLYTVEQFLENDVLPPKDHPVYDDERFIRARQKREKERESHNGSDDKSAAVGQIGGLKNDSQKEQVVRLASELDKYFNQSVSEAHLKKKRRERSNGRSGIASRAPRGVRNFMRSRAPAVSSVASEGMALSFYEQRCDVRGVSDTRERSVMSAASGRRVMLGSLDDEDVQVLPPSMQRGRVCREMSTDDDDDGSIDDEDAQFRTLPRERMSMSMEDEGVHTPYIQRDQSSVAPPQDPKEYAKKIEQELKSGSKGSDWKDIYQLEKKKFKGDVSPSFFLACARLVRNYGKNLDAIRIATNCLELGIEDAQLLRSTAYFLLSSKHSDGVDLALRVFERVKELQPCEPQSFLDLAMAIFWKSFLSKDDLVSVSILSELAKSVSAVQKLIAHVITHRWADRFLEIEWAALVLLHFVADFVKETNRKLGCKEKDIPEWPSSELASCFQQKETDPLRCSKFDVSLLVWLGWDTDHTDVDLHVIEPTKNEVFYSNRNSTVGGHLSRDFTQGCGPEVYLLKDWKENSRAQAGKYDVFAKYYASHQDSVLTGTTSALLWTMEKNREKGGYEMGFETVRLDTHKEKTKIKTLQLWKIPSMSKTS